MFGCRRGAPERGRGWEEEEEEEEGEEGKNRCDIATGIEGHRFLVPLNCTYCHSFWALFSGVICGTCKVESGGKQVKSMASGSGEFFKTRNIYV